ncbi:MAG: DUF2089 domain-containing protein [Myxococcota bacterium]
MPESTTHPAPTRCPVCAEALQVTRLECPDCHSALEGRFTFGRWRNLTREQWEFIEQFIRCRGKIKDVEQVLGVSYPTVVARLNEVVAAMGFDAPAAPGPDVAARRQQVLDELAAGTITAAEAATRLRALS